MHRDVKPGNVLLDERDHAYVTDFGLATSGREGLTQTGDFAGTLDFVAPERIRGQRGDARVDVYALGCLLYAALTGGVPYARESQAATLFAHVSDPVPAPSSASATLSPFDAVVQPAMAKDPDDRYASAAEFAASLAAVSTVTEAVPPPPPVPQALGDPGTPWG